MRAMSLAPALPRLAVALLLVLAVGACYAQVVDHQFISYDDLGYVSENPQVRAGLTARGVAWAFKSGEMSNWHPLTWLSHMLDWQLYGPRAGLHKLTSVALHAGNALLLLAVLRRMTGSFWRSALVAGVFALHPLRVQSVAWVSERKDVLSIFFGLLALWAYAGYADVPKARRYLLVCLLFALSLLAKPMLVTLPFLLLLIDVWPLGRASGAAWGRAEEGEDLSGAAVPDARPRFGWARLVAEKVPLLGLSIASSVITFIVQDVSGAVATTEKVPLAGRLANATWAYVAYLVTTVWPRGLTFFYPYDPKLPLATVAGAAAALVALTALALALRRGRPWVGVGWFWYLGTLVPVIGIVQVGGQSMADRYTYFPVIGVTIALVWSMPGRWGRSAAGRAALGAAGVALLGVLAWRTWVEVGYWKDDRTLFARAVEATPDNYMAWINHGGVLGMSGQTQAAADAFRRAVALAPEYSKAHYNLGWTLAGLNRPAEAEACYREALRINPFYTDARANLAAVLNTQGRRDEALKELREAVRREPGHNVAVRALAMNLIDHRLIEEAIPMLERAVALEPTSAELRNNLATALDHAGQSVRAVEQFEKAVALDPRNPGHRENLGNVLLRLNRFGQAADQFAQAQALGARSVGLHRKLAAALVPLNRLGPAADQIAQACRLEPENHELRTLLGGLLAQQGRLPEARRELEEALRLKPDFEPAQRTLQRIQAAAAPGR